MYTYMYTYIPIFTYCCKGRHVSPGLPMVCQATERGPPSRQTNSQVSTSPYSPEICDRPLD